MVVRNMQPIHLVISMVVHSMYNTVGVYSLFLTPPNRNCGDLRPCGDNTSPPESILLRRIRPNNNSGKLAVLLRARKTWPYQ